MFARGENESRSLGAIDHLGEVDEGGVSINRALTSLAQERLTEKIVEVENLLPVFSKDVLTFSNVRLNYA
jgi:hypothetical protein